MKQDNHTEQSPQPSSKELPIILGGERDFFSLTETGARPNKIKGFTWDNVINWITELAPFYEKHHLISAWNRLLDEFARSERQCHPIAHQLFLHILRHVPKDSMQKAYTIFLTLHPHFNEEQEKQAQKLFVELHLYHYSYHDSDNINTLYKILNNLPTKYKIEEKPKIWQIFLRVAYQNLQYRESIWEILIDSIEGKDINSFKEFLYDSYIRLEDWFPKYMQALDYIEYVRKGLKDKLFINPLFNPIKIIGATNEQSEAIPSNNSPTVSFRHDPKEHFCGDGQEI
jgi:hypothetical protein